MSNPSSQVIRRSTTGRWIAAVVLSAGCVWSYWPTIVDLWLAWQINLDYSVGQIVPFVAVGLIWANRKTLQEQPVRVCWWGLGVLLIAQVFRFLGLFYLYGSLERYSLVLTLAGGVLFLFGYPVARRLVWIFAFLLLMVPLPHRVHAAIALPLQDFASASAVVGLEMLGYVVARQGNVLHLSEETAVAVAEACNGLRMLTAFVFVAATLAFVVRRPPWQKALLVLSSIPVAILANTLRLVVTVILYDAAGSETAERFFHGFAGVSMMPFAVLVLIGELWVIGWMVGNREKEGST